MGNTYSPPPFLTVHAIALPLASYCHPSKKKKKKRAAPGERVTIATAFTRATLQSVHLSCMLQPRVSTYSRTWDFMVWGRKETGRLPGRWDGTRGGHRGRTDVQQLISLTGRYRRCIQCTLTSKMTHSLHAKPG